MRDETGRARGGLRCEVVPVEKRDVPAAALREVEGRGGTEAARADHHDVRALDHPSTMTLRSSACPALPVRIEARVESFTKRPDG